MSNYIYNLQMVDDSYLAHFSTQYSYEADPDYEDDYFKITNEGLDITLHDYDLPFIKNSKSYPRTELRGLDIINDDVEYVATWDQYIKTYSDNFWFIFAQIFGKNGPNVMLLWNKNQYELLALQGKNKKIPIKLNITDDIRKWTNWRIEFLLKNLDGYVKVFRNNVLVGELRGNTAGENDSYWKQGIYAHECQVKNTSIVVKKLTLSTL